MKVEERESLNHDLQVLFLNAKPKLKLLLCRLDVPVSVHYIYIYI